MTQLAKKWMASDVKKLKHFPEGCTRKFMETPESKKSKPLKYLYKRYTQSLKAQELDAKFECMTLVSDLVASGKK